MGVFPAKKRREAIPRISPSLAARRFFAGKTQSKGIKNILKKDTLIAFDFLKKRHVHPAVCLLSAPFCAFAATIGQKHPPPPPSGERVCVGCVGLGGLPRRWLPRFGLGLVGGGALVARFRWSRGGWSAAARLSVSVLACFFGVRRANNLFHKILFS